MRRSFLAVLLTAALLVLTLTACGGDPAVSDPGSAPDGTTTTVGADGTDTTTTTSGADSTDTTAGSDASDDTSGGATDNAAGTTTGSVGKDTTGKVTNGKTTTTTKKTTATTKGDGFKGTTYYVSSSTGSDWNDGDSEAKPVASLAVAGTLGEPGDRVLFKRGDIWRGDSLTTREGVTYGAYGSGENPRFYGSAKNYAIKNKWKQTSSNARVWYFDEVISLDVGGVVMNDGESFGLRRDSVSALKADRNYYYDPNEGRVYLFSRNGNPAEVWSSIEFNERVNIVSLKTDDVVFENITIRYCDYGIVGGGNKNVTIRNCDFSWIGGCLHNYADTTRYGNAIEFWGSVDGLTVDSCRFSQIFDTAVTCQFSGAANVDATVRNVTVSNNTVDKCQWSMEFWLNCKDGSGKPLGTIDGIKILNNKFTNAGGGWSAGQRWGGGGLSSSTHLETFGSTNLVAKVANILIKGNVFDSSEGTLLGIRWNNCTPTLEGNTYIQEKGKSFGVINGNEGTWKFDDSIAAKIKKYDPTAKVEFSK